MKLYKGILIECYMKNGQVIMEDGLKFNHPVDENNAELREFITKVNNEIKKVLMVNNAGHLVLGTLHLRSNECQAVRVTLVEDDGQYKECEVNG